jgi:hypothetical protein
MDVGGEADPGRIRAEHWQAMAKALGMRPPFIAREISDMVEALTQALPGVKDNLEAAHGDLPMLQQPEQVVRTQLRLASG